MFPPDDFAHIAARGPSVAVQLVRPAPPAPPKRVVRLAGVKAGAAFSPVPTLGAAGFDRALGDLRAKMEKFGRSFAAKAPVTRVRRTLDRWQWREETPEDRRDFARVTAGAGEWQDVVIPHYGGPIGLRFTLYRHEFDAAELGAPAGRELWVCFRGADYKAEVYLNGALLGTHEGFFAAFEFLAAAALRPGRNVLVVRLGNDSVHQGTNGVIGGCKEEGEKIYAATGPGWDEPGGGWHHCPPGMGLFDTVSLELRESLFVGDVWVRPLDLEGQCELWVEVQSTQGAPRAVELAFQVDGENFRGRALAPRRVKDLPPASRGENRYVVPFVLRRPRRWELDAPWLYRATVSVCDETGRRRDTATRVFGVRVFKQDVQSEPKGRFYLNGRAVRLRGTNTMGHEQQRVMAGDLAGLRDDLLIYKLAHMNFVRITQRPVQREVYEAADRLGLLIQTDLPLFAYLRRTQFVEAARQAGEMERHIRAHPSCVLVSYINEPFPAPWGNRFHRQLTRRELHAFFRAADEVVRLHNPDRVIKAVDGDYEPPGPGFPDNHVYPAWYVGHAICLGQLHRGEWVGVAPGWLYGCGEFGAEGLDPADLMRRRYPAAWLPKDAADEATWTPARIHQAQTGELHLAWFDRQHSLEDWVRESQAFQAWATRFVTEALRRDRRMVSFAIHLGIDAWPAGWMKTIVDCERRPKPAYFAYRDAIAPVTVQLRGDRPTWWSGETVELEAWICNDTAAPIRDARLRVQVEQAGRVLHAEVFAAAAPADDSVAVARVHFTAPQVAERGAVVVRLGLEGPAERGRARLRVHHETTLKVFAPVGRPAGELCILPGDDAAAGIAAELAVKARELAPRGAHENRTWLVADAARLSKALPALVRAARAGDTVVLVDPPEGRVDIPGAPLEVVKTGMNPLYFATRATGHAMVEGFEPRDFWLWHDQTRGRIAPLMERVGRGEGWTTILGAGDGGWGKKWEPAHAAAELSLGDGRVRVCHVQLAGRVRVNPAACLFARRLLGLGGEATRPRVRRRSRALADLPSAAAK